MEEMENKEQQEETLKDELTLLREQNERLAEALAAAKDSELRSLAEMDNVRKRLTKEFDDKLKYSNLNLISALFPVMDNFEMALSHISTENPVEVLKEGVQLTLKQMGETLEKYGLKEIELTVGDDFNPQFHEALMVDCDENYEDNKILMVLQKGYTLHGRVVRPSKVKVNKRNK
ncbi:nucleotide exchange factor GrpE [Seleniivibrio sp.]|uniref:nucleotide exchange factor GrpE n=1 Tax=Seleniivibrio sp. TaxID=2898801 RepID=UPI0025D97AB6|nr:nucleotide exchange factor GrpE [Seleniivibrio sp.]MCD8552951.1 nucleotide exchange factor GrpE [Seleniivibrio sp.]